MEVTLKSGKKVKVDAFNLGFTYSGLLEGNPNKRINLNIYDRTTYPEEIWGSRKSVKIRPRGEDFENWLKPAHYSAWLHSNQPINPKFHGSELVVIWFGEMPDGRPIEDIIQKGVENIVWENHAQDFEY